MKNIKKTGFTAKNTDNHKLFLKGFREHKKKKSNWKWILAGIASVSLFSWIISAAAAIPAYGLFAVFGIIAATVLAFVITESLPPKCPACKIRMRKLKPAVDDYNTTHKYFCGSCKIWIDTGRRESGNF